VKEFLSQQGVTWTEKMVDSDREAAIQMIRVSGQRGVPVTVIGDEVVVGFDRPRLEHILASMPKAASQKPKRPAFGAKVADAANYELEDGKTVKGAYVGGVHLDSPAEIAGFRPGDVITAVGGTPVGSVADLQKVLAGLEESKVPFSVYRRGRDYNIEVIFPNPS
jgi:membrane-associated protease RseP (regulator of RpoE activity)